MESLSVSVKENVGFKTKPFFKKSLFSFKNLNKLLFLVIIILGLYYVVGANDLAIKGYVLSDLKQQRNKLAEANKNEELKAMTISSYNNISQKINNLNMVAVGSVNYINGSVAAVAKK